MFQVFDMKEADAKGQMCFAIQRTDLTKNETIWLRSSKIFPACALPSVSKTPADMYPKLFSNGKQLTQTPLIL